jgi:hypothetical protein
MSWYSGEEKFFHPRLNRVLKYPFSFGAFYRNDVSQQMFMNHFLIESSDQEFESNRTTFHCMVITFCPLRGSALHTFINS